MAFVLLPCDLPTWPTITRHLRSLREARTPAQVTEVIHTLYSLSNASMEPDLLEPVPPDLFASLTTFLEEEVDPEEFFGLILPALLDAALALKDLKPQEGMRYSLQQQHGEVVVPRGLATSLLAHVFFCTLPRRSPLTHPTLADPRLAPTLAATHRVSQRVKVRAVLQYFRRMAEAPTQGDVTFARKVMSSSEFVTLKDWLGSEEVLCPVDARHEGRLQDAHPPALLACFASPDLAQPALAPTKAQQVSAMLSYPEMLVSSVFVERLEDNEAMQVTGVLRTASVSCLKTRPGLTPTPHTPPPDIIHALMDADDYRQSEILQYEEINVLRELNKALLAFTQPLPDTLPASSCSDIVSVSRQMSEGSMSPPVRSRTDSSATVQRRLREESLDDTPPPRPPKWPQLREESLDDVMPPAPDTSHRKTDRLKKKVGIADTPRTDCDSEGRSHQGQQGQQGVTCEGEGGFVTAPTTLKRRGKRRKDPRVKGRREVESEDKGSQTDPIPPPVRERVTFAHTPRGSGAGSDAPLSPGESDDGVDETTKLLNRVLRAIQRLEQDRPDLLDPHHQEPPNAHAKPPPPPAGKPPLPCGTRGPCESSRRLVLRDDADGDAEAAWRRRRVGVAEDGRRLSIYLSCSDEAYDPPDDDPYFSACESLDGTDGEAGPPRPPRRRSKRSQRKQSFAERLREAMAREPSDASHPEPIDRLTQDDLALEKAYPLLFAHLEEAKEEERGRGGEDRGRSREEEGEDDEEGLGSSHYSFSTDYTSELEDVYERLGEVLEESERGNLGPRTTAIAKYAHGLLKRALSESCKDIPLSLDGCALKDPQGGSGGPKPIRSLSFNGPQPPPSSGMRAPTLYALKSRGKPVVTGNWGCGSLRGDHQLKAMIQWAAASKARAPRLVYYTCGDTNTVKLDIVTRLLGDRSWRVGDLVATILRYSESRIDSWRRSRESDLTESADSSLPESLRYRGPSIDSLTLFDELIGADRPYSTMETEL